MRSYTELQTDMCKVKNALRTLKQIKKNSLLKGKVIPLRSHIKGPCGFPVVGQDHLLSWCLLASVVAPGYPPVFTRSVSTSSGLSSCAGFSADGHCV